MTDVAAPTLTDQAATVDVEAVVQVILSRPRHGAMSASTAAIVAMAERIVDLEAIAAGTLELLAQIDALRGTYAADTVRNSAAIAPVIDGLVGALEALGYADPQPPPPPQGDDT